MHICASICLGVRVCANVLRNVCNIIKHTHTHTHYAGPRLGRGRQAPRRRRRRVLTHTAQALLAHAHQNVEAQIAVSRPFEMLETPYMDAIVLYILRKDNGDVNVCK